MSRRNFIVCTVCSLLMVPWLDQFTKQGLTSEMIIGAVLIAAIQFLLFMMYPLT